jgi:uncharacterized BrkB/YihY/UPF0761 family membrane protein
MMMAKKTNTGGALFYILAVIYIGLLFLFGYQTGVFVNWLFPNDQIMMKILTVVCFDGMAFLWAITDLFYHFACKNTRDLVRWGWGVSFILSLLASILYLVISSMFRFEVQITATWVDVGYGIVITAIVFQIIMVTFFLYIEWVVRHPYNDDYLHASPVTQEEMGFYARELGIPVKQQVALAQRAESKKKVKELPTTQKLEGSQVAGTRAKK